MTEVISIASIRMQAKTHAHFLNAHASQACPYPDGSDAQRVYLEAFNKARQEIQARIEREARFDAQHHSDVNECCPHPFGSPAGRMYREAFLQERAAIEAKWVAA